MPLALDTANKRAIEAGIKVYNLSLIHILVMADLVENIVIVRERG